MTVCEPHGNKVDDMLEEEKVKTQFDVLSEDVGIVTMRKVKYWQLRTISLGNKKKYAVTNTAALSAIYQI